MASRCSVGLESPIEQRSPLSCVQHRPDQSHHHVGVLHLKFKKVSEDISFPSSALSFVFTVEGCLTWYPPFTFLSLGSSFNLPFNILRFLSKINRHLASADFANSLFTSSFQISKYLICYADQLLKPNVFKHFDVPKLLPS